MLRAEDYLQHAGTYDPVKAHEYYMRTRVLKGRKLGKTQTDSTATASKKSKTAPAARSAIKSKEQLSKRIAKLRERAAKEQKTIAKKLKAYLNQVDLQNPATVDLKRQAFETKNRKAAASIDRQRVSKELSAAIEKAQAAYKRHVKSKKS